MSNRPKHPSEELTRLLRGKKLTYQKASDLTGISGPHLHMLTHGCRSFTPMVAEKLEKAGLGAAMDWLNTQAQWSAWKEKQKGSPDGEKSTSP